MRSYEIFRECPTEVVNEIFVYLHEHEKGVYRAIIQNIATQRKLRPVFIERKPKTERHEWLRQALSRKPADDVAAQTLQIWLLGAQKDLICQFLDALEIAHDGKGFVHELPPEPPSEKLKAAVDHLVESHRPEIIAVYLQPFSDDGRRGLERFRRDSYDRRSAEDRTDLWCGNGVTALHLPPRLQRYSPLFHISLGLTARL